MLTAARATARCAAIRQQAVRTNAGSAALEATVTGAPVTANATTSAIEAATEFPSVWTCSVFATICDSAVDSLSSMLANCCSAARNTVGSRPAVKTHAATTAQAAAVSIATMLTNADSKTVATPRSLPTMRTATEGHTQRRQGERPKHATWPRIRNRMPLLGTVVHRPHKALLQPVTTEAALAFAVRARHERQSVRALWWRQNPQL